MGIGRAIAKLFVTIALDKSEFDAGTKGVKSGAQDLLSGFKSVASAAGVSTGAIDVLGSAMGMAADLGAVYLARKLADTVIQLGLLGAESDRANVAFARVAEGAGMSADSLFNAVDQAFRGTIDDERLMYDMNRAMIMGLQLTEEQWVQLAKGASYHARLTGQSTIEVFEGVITAIERGQPRMLTALGFAGAKDALKEYGNELDLATSNLSEAERQATMYGVAVDQMNGEMAKYGKFVPDAITANAQLQESLARLKDELGTLFSGPAEYIIHIALDITGATTEAMDVIKQLSVIVNYGLGGLGLGSGEAAGLSGLAGAQANAAEALGDKANAARIAAEAELAEATAAKAEAEATYLSVLQGDAFTTISFELAHAALVEANQRWGVARARAYDLGILEDETAAVQEATTEERGFTSATEQATAAVGAVNTALGYVNTVLHSLGFKTAAEAALEYANAMRQVVDATKGITTSEAASGLQSSLSQLQSQLTGLTGTVDTGTLRAKYSEYEAELIALFSNTTNMTDFELALRVQTIMGHLDDEVDAFRNAGRQEKSVLEDMSSQYEAMRSAVRSALQPTAVTAMDFDQSAAGSYVEKWDENARRLQAIAENGFSEIQKHADWVGILKIPPEVLAGSEEALKAWASGVAEQVRNLSRPDLLNVKAAAEQVREYMRDQAAQEVSIDLVVKELAATGGLSEEDARKQVLSAYGLEKEIPVSFTLAEGAKDDLVAAIGGSKGSVDVPVNLVAAQATEKGKGGAEQSGGAIGDQLVSGITLSMTQSQLTLQFVAYMNEDIKAQKDALKNAGIALWAATSVGIEEAMKQAQYARQFAEAIAPIVAEILSAQGQWVGG